MIEHLSYSSISTWLMCPRSWRFRYVDKVEMAKSPALVFGSVFHNAIEEYIREKPIIPHKVDILLAHWKLSWEAQLEQNSNVSWDKTPYEYENLGVTMLSNPETVAIIDNIVPLVGEDGLSVIEKKVELRVPGVPVPVIGYIDVIEGDGVPADLKTSARSWSQKRADGEMQPTFYLAALNQLGHQVVGQFRYYVFTKGRNPHVEIWDTYRTAADMFWLFGLIGDVWNAIERGAFPPNPTTWKCSPKWCEYWSGCRG